MDSKAFGSSDAMNLLPRMLCLGNEVSRRKMSDGVDRTEFSRIQLLWKSSKIGARNMQPKLNGSATSFIDGIRNALEQQYGAGQVVLCKLRDDSGVVVILPMREDGNTNAQIYNASGDVRCEIEIPDSFRGGIGFTDAFYVNDQLTAIFVTQGRDFAFVIDEKTGKATRTYETR